MTTIVRELLDELNTTWERDSVVRIQRLTWRGESGNRKSNLRGWVDARTNVRAHIGRRVRLYVTSHEVQVWEATLAACQYQKHWGGRKIARLTLLDARRVTVMVPV